MANDMIKAPCPVCSCQVKKPARWFRVVRNLVRYAILYASLNGRDRA
jgi:hypothetical protein